MSTRPQKIFLCLSLFILPIALQAKTILIFAGIPRGGMGDISANWTMAKQLKTLQPNDQIIFVVDESAKASPDGTFESAPEILRKLVPAYRPFSSQTIEGIEVISASQNSIPNADYGLAFSMRVSDNLPNWLQNKTRFTMIFSEPSSLGLGPSIVKRTGDEPDRGLISENKITPTNSGFAIALSTGAQSRGIYTFPVRPDPPLTRVDTLKKLMSFASIRIIHRAAVRSRLIKNPLENSLLGLSYTYHSGPTQKYIELMKRLARSSKYKDQALTVFVKDFPDLRVDGLPANLQVIKYQNMPAELHESLIAHSDLPIQITGSMSMSLAAQYGKLYFGDHSAPGNIVGAGIGVLRRLQSEDPFFKDPRFDSIFRADGIMQSQALSADEQLRFGPSIDLLTELSQSDEFATRFLQLNEKLASKWSLAFRVFRYLGMLDQMKHEIQVRDISAIAQAFDAIDERILPISIANRDRLLSVDQLCQRVLSGLVQGQKSSPKKSAY